MLYRAFKEGNLEATQQQMSLMYGRYVGDSRPTTDRTASGVADRLRIVVTAAAKKDWDVANYAFNQFLDRHYSSYNDNFYPDDRNK